MKTDKIIIFTIIVVVFVIFVFRAMKGAINVSGAEAHKIVKDGGLLLDVRTPEEFREGAIEGAINIPIQSLKENLSRIPDQNRPIVVYCKSGGRSSKAKEILDKAGYKQVINLGGIDNWYQTEETYQ